MNRCTPGNFQVELSFFEFGIPETGFPAGVVNIVHMAGVFLCTTVN
jgi:hypothetical protein